MYELLKKKIAKMVEEIDTLVDENIELRGSINHLENDVYQDLLDIIKRQSQEIEKLSSRLMVEGEINTRLNNILRRIDDLEKSMNNAGQCVICITEDAGYAIVPCGHRCICKECFLSSLSSLDRCPICRETVTHIMPVYN